MQQSSHDDLDVSVTAKPAGHDATVATAVDRRLSALSAHVADTAAEAAVVAGVPATTGSNTSTSAARSKVKIAAVVTEYRRYSHAQHICDRFLIGYGWGNKHHKPACDLVALYVDQHDESTHLAEKRCAEFPIMKRYGSIAEALCLGGDKLAVDGVLLIGEHGTYPKTEAGMTRYPCVCPLSSHQPHHHELADSACWVPWARLGG